MKVSHDAYTEGSLRAVNRKNSSRLQRNPTVIRDVVSVQTCTIIERVHENVQK